MLVCSFLLVFVGLTVITTVRKDHSQGYMPGYGLFYGKAISTYHFTVSLEIEYLIALLLAFDS
jgi:hypothetical protein